MSLLNWARILTSHHDVRSSGKWFLISVVIGIIAGLGAVVFQIASQSVLHFTLARLAGYDPAEPAGEHRIFLRQPQPLTPWLVLPVIAVGGLVSGLIVFTFAPEAEGHGTDAAIA